ncbi:NAD(P)-binding protein, partial [Aureobasidium melanogenum]
MSTKAATKKIVVAGGNGFLGSRICKAAAARGWQVTSISRSGEPTWSSVTSSPVAPTWSSDVNWVSANILQPSTYKQHLENADSVVHSMGILLEADYKGVLTGKEPIIGGLQKAFSSTKQGTQNPLERKEGSDVEPQHEGGQITYEVMNRDSAILLAKEASAAGAKSMAYISAAGGAPILPARYIKTKREAEES